MGMFDEIRCEYALPLPEAVGELSGFDWQKYAWQTKDLECLLGRYCIRSDGTLWMEARSFADESNR